MKYDFAQYPQESPPAPAVPRTRPRMALVGAGGFGEVHLRELAALHHRGEIHFSAVADPAIRGNPLLRERLKAHSVRGYESLEELLAEEADLDAIDIATPPHTHLPLTRLALAAGCKVLLEKPPAPLLGQLDQMLALPGARDIAVNFQMASISSFRRMDQHLRLGRLGRLRSLRAICAWPRGPEYYARNTWAGRFLADGEPVLDGPSTNALSHLIHCLTLLACPHPGQAASPARVQGAFFRSHGLASHDTAVIRGAFENEVEFSVALTHGKRETQPFVMVAEGDRGQATFEEEQFAFFNTVGLRPRTFDCRPYYAPAFRNFARFLNGRLARPRVRLEQCRGITMINNLAMLSAGGVRPLPGREDEAATEKCLDALLDSVFREGDLPRDAEWDFGDWGRRVCQDQAAELTRERCRKMAPLWEAAGADLSPVRAGTTEAGR